MNRRFSTNFAIFTFLSDIAILVGVFCLEKFYILQLPNHQAFFGNEGLPWAFFILITPIWLIYGFLFSIYDGTKTQKFIDELTHLSLSFLLFSFTNSGILYLTYRDISRKLFLLFLLLSFILMFLVRVICRALYVRHLQKKQYVSRVLIIGAGVVGREIVDKIGLSQNHPIEFVGFLDDDPEKKRLPDVLGGLDMVQEAIKKHRIDEVIIALPARAYDRTASLVNELNETAVKLYIVPDYFHWALHHLQITDFSGIPMIDLRSPAISEYQRITKRLFDVVMSLFFIVLTSPIMAIIAVLIKLFDGGPVFFIQDRIGENGHIIKIFKFRSMVVGADKKLNELATIDKDGHVIHKRRNDPRITPIGKIIRRFSLDELPQFFNILNGTMSLVGPRPELPELVKLYQPWQRKRFSVPQGLTGWWQIHGRSDRPMHLNSEDDLYYIQHYSIWLDLYILIKTFWVVLRGHGAY